MRLGIVGGSFDPVQYAHLKMAECMEDLELDEVWLMPCYSHAFEKRMESFEHRKNMIELALEELGNKRIKVSDFEKKRGIVSYTVDTIRDLKKELDSEIYWAVGADIMDSFENWKEPEEIVKLSRLVIFPRNGKQPKKIPNNAIYMKDCNLPYLSSTEIRERLSRKETIKGMTPSPVIDYIRKNNLYVR